MLQYIIIDLDVGLERVYFHLETGQYGVEIRRHPKRFFAAQLTSVIVTSLSKVGEKKK